jgi:hypothetical protein
MLPSFPVIAPPIFPLEEDFPDQTISSTSEGGYRQSRPRTTRMPGTWKLKWNTLRDSDYQSLIEFWKAIAHGTAEQFTWQHPHTGMAYSVRFLSKPAFQLTEHGWSGECTLEEV